MSRNNRGLGRGFESLIPTQIVEEALDPTAKTDEKLSNLREVPVASVEPDSNQPRENFDDEALASLAASIKTHGILQPLVVTEVTDDKYQIIAGERRWRAAKLAGLKTLPVLVRSLSAQHTLEVALIENVQRRDLGPLELATAYLKLHDQFNMTYKQIGERVGKTLGAVNNTVRLLALSDEVKQALHDGLVGEGHARTLLAIDDPLLQAEIVKRMINEQWSVRKAEAYVSNLRKQAQPGSEKQAKKPTMQETTETKYLSGRLKTNVYLQPNTRGGKIVIEYKNQADLTRLLDNLEG